MDLRLPLNMIANPVGGDEGFASYAKRIGLLFLTVMVVAVLLLLSSLFVAL